MKKLYFTWAGLGDSLVLLGAAYNYFKKTNERLTIGCDWKDLALKSPYVDYVDWFSFRQLYSRGVNFMLEEARQKGFSPMFITASGYKYLAPKYESNVTVWANKHMITRYCERIGLSGDIEIEIPLEIKTEQKSKDDLICVMVGGIQKYKAIDPKVIQFIVDNLRKDFQIVQLGATSDPLLEHVQDMRGRSIIEAYRFLKKSKFFVGGVGGLLHLARAANCRSFVLQTTAEPQSLTYYTGNKYIHPLDYCDVCAKNFRDPQHQPCFYGYKCSTSFDGKRALDLIVSEMADWTSAVIMKQIEQAIADPANGIEDFYHSHKTLTCLSAYY